MAKQALIFTITAGTLGVFHAGTVIDDTEARYTTLVNAGAIFAPMANSGIAAAQAKAATRRAAGDSGDVLDGIMQAAYDAMQSATESADAAVKIQKVSVAIAFADFAALSGGVKTKDYNFPALPAGARLLGAAVEGFTGFDDPAHGTEVITAGTTAGGTDIFGSTNVHTGQTGFPKPGATPGALGYVTAPLGGATPSARITASADLNTITIGAATVVLFYFVLA